MKNLNIEIEITEQKTVNTDGSWIGSARINGKIYTGEFASEETYEVDGEEIEVIWKDYLN